MSENQETTKQFQRTRRNWPKKFADAFLGIWQGARGQSSFAVHLVAAIAVAILAACLSLPLEHWCLLVLCIGMVLAAELFNSSLEKICRSVTDEFDPNIRDVLNIASGAVLVLSLAAAIVGGVIFLNAFFG